MKIYVGVTDQDWYEFLSRRQPWDEVNFWQPSGGRRFGTLQPGDLFLFKLHAPLNTIVGGGFFAHWTSLPVSLAWEAFTEGNGVGSLLEMKHRIGRYRGGTAVRADHVVGCIVLIRPFFVPASSWLPMPRDWSLNIVQGKSYDTGSSIGRELYESVRTLGISDEILMIDQAPPTRERYGRIRAVRGRLGQGAFQVLVTDAYARRCAITAERTLPALEAAHIRPYSEGGEHWIDNGLLLRRDLHALFDRGYVTVTPNRVVEVSRRIKEEFENGRDYYALHGRPLHPPDDAESGPSEHLLRWHNEAVYLG